MTAQQYWDRAFLAALPAAITAEVSTGTGAHWCDAGAAADRAAQVADAAVCVRREREPNLRGVVGVSVDCQEVAA